MVYGGFGRRGGERDKRTGQRQKRKTDRWKIDDGCSRELAKSTTDKPLLAGGRRSSRWGGYSKELGGWRDRRTGRKEEQMRIDKEVDECRVTSV